MDGCGKKFVKHYLNKENVIEMEMQDCFSRFTNDVIASSVFGANVDSLNEPDNEFYLRGRQTTDLTKLTFIAKLICSMSFPKLYKVSKLFLLLEVIQE